MNNCNIKKKCVPIQLSIVYCMSFYNVGVQSSGLVFLGYIHCGFCNQ